MWHDLFGAIRWASVDYPVRFSAKDSAAGPT
jgi:hypothetical protein